MVYTTDVSRPPEDALSALYRAVYNRLRGGGAWGDRVYPEQAPSGAEYPYVIYAEAGGAESLDVRGAGATYDMVIRVVVGGQNYRPALFAARQAIAALLHNQGTQDGTSAPLDAGDHWQITTATVGESQHDPGTYEGVVPLHQSGFTFTFNLRRA